MSDTSLQQFVQSVNGNSRLRVEKDYGDGFVRLHTSEAERRQSIQDIQCTEDIILEILRNSRDAHASHIFLATSKSDTIRSITIIDDGDGIPQSMHQNVFLPRVTSKLDTSHKDNWGLHGRGMALFSIKENAQSAYVKASKKDMGTSIIITTNTTSLKEKTDQSTFPRFILEEGSNINIRGPKNILRVTCEFAVYARKNCSIYLGSPAEIVASLYEHGTRNLSAFERSFCKNIFSLPLVMRPSTASDPADLVEIASSLGLDISERTARRIINKELGGCMNLLDTISIDDQRAGLSVKKHSKSRLSSPKRISFQKKDKERLSKSVSRAYKSIAQEYYLNPNVEPSVRISNETISISIPIIPDEE